MGQAGLPGLRPCAVSSVTVLMERPSTDWQKSFTALRELRCAPLSSPTRAVRRAPYPVMEPSGTDALTVAPQAARSPY